VVEDVEVACERVIVMSRGRIVFDGPPPGLAAAADGRVWVATLAPGEEEQLPESARVVDQIPEASGAMRTRILHAERPHPAAEREEPSLQDGYLWLVGTGIAA